MSHRNRLSGRALRYRRTIRKNKEMELTKITRGNLEQEHICHAISSNKDIQVMTKKAWLKEKLDEGLIFLKCNVRGECSIEYILAGYVWASIEAGGYMYINCLRVSGQFKGLGCSTLLLDECIRDSKEKGEKGLVILPSEKEMGYLSDPEYPKYEGLETADVAGPHFELMYLAFGRNADEPCFRHAVKNHEDMPRGLVLYYTNQCFLTVKYVPSLEKAIKERNVELQTVHIQTREDAQNAPALFTTFSLFRDGELLTHEILSEKKFDKLISQADSG